MTDLLVLQYDSLSKRIEALFEDLRKSPAEQDLFIRNPALVISEKILGGSKQIPQATLNKSNRLIYALLSNPKFLKWASQYQLKISRDLRKARALPDRREAKKRMLVILNRRNLYRDLAEGIREFGDPELFFSEIYNEGHNFPGFGG